MPQSYQVQGSSHTNSVAQTFLANCRLVNLSLRATLIWHVWTSKVLSGIIGLHWS